MPIDQPPDIGRNPGPEPDDDAALIAELAAFGLTLEHEVADPIRSTAPANGPHDRNATASATLLVPQPAEASTGQPLERSQIRTGSRVLWFAAAAALVALVAIGSYLVSDRPSTTDPVGEDRPTENLPTEDLPTEDIDQPEPAEAATPIPILATDGTVLATVDPGFGNDPTPDRALPMITYLEARELGAVGFVDATISQLLGASPERRWEELVGQGLASIETSLDPEAQRIALDVTDDERLADTPVSATLVTIDVATGAVVAMIGDTPDGFSVATDGLLQPGSTVKPIVAAEAFEQGFTPADTVRGAGPCTFAMSDETRYTVGGEPGPELSIQRALAESNNCGFVRLGAALGNDRVAARFELMGLTTLPPEAGEFLSLPVGTTDVHPVELASAYAGFANDGLVSTPSYVTALTSTPEAGERGSDVAALPVRQAVSPETARLITASLKEAVEDGTGRNARLADGHVAAGKTGTTNDSTAGWFAGYTPHYATVVAVTDVDRINRIEIDGEPLTGGGIPAELWAAYNDRLHADLEPVLFPEPPSIDGEPRLIETEIEVD